jgi:hypothetical protein
MTVPKFQCEDLNPELRLNTPGDAFQRFAGECLRHKYPGLECFRTGGKDGAIDICWTEGSNHAVIETKYIGREDTLHAAQREWRAIAKHLGNHLVDPQGPTKSQAQYRPWYSTEPTISEYGFCSEASVEKRDFRLLSKVGRRPQPFITPT